MTAQAERGATSAFQSSAPRWILPILLLSLGALADAVLHSRNPGFGAPVTAIAGTLILAWYARPTRAAWAVLGTGISAAAFMAVRSSPGLLMLDFCTGIALGVLGASFAREGDPVWTGLRSYVVRGFRLFFSIPGAIGFFVPPVSKLSSAPGAGRVAAGIVRRSIRALIIAGGAALVFALVLSSADPVFAHVISTPFRVSFPLENVVQHGLTIAFATMAAALVVDYATRLQPADSGGVTVSAGFSLGGAEWKLLFIAVDALFALFVAIQFAYLFGGAERIVADAGLTYADYARGGFAQMVFAALLALGLIGFVWIAGARDAGNPVAFRILAGTLLGLVGIVLISAYHRLTLYEGAFGWTMTRLLGHAIILWFGAFLVCSLVAVIVGRARWLAFAGIALALAAVLGLNAMNADRFIAERNLARYADTGKLDATYLTRLSDDAVPTLVAALPTLPRDARATVETNLACRRWVLDQPRNLLSANLGLSNAQEALDASAIPPDPAAGPGGCDVSSD